jgi:hypothetical protein
LLEGRKSINEQIKEIIEEASTLTSSKKPLIRSAFRYVQKKQENGKDELDDIVSIAEGLEE